MHHVFAVSGLIAGILVWFLVQRWSGSGAEEGCGDCEVSDCSAREASRGR